MNIDVHKDYVITGRALDDLRKISERGYPLDLSTKQLRAFMNNLHHVTESLKKRKIRDCKEQAEFDNAEFGGG